MQIILSRGTKIWIKSSENYLIGFSLSISLPLSLSFSLSLPLSLSLSLSLSLWRIFNYLKNLV